MNDTLECPKLVCLKMALIGVKQELTDMAHSMDMDLAAAAALVALQY